MPVRLEGPEQALSNLLDALDACPLVCRDICRTDDADVSACELLLDTRNTTDWQRLLNELSQQAQAEGATLRAFTDHGTVSVVGEGIAEQSRCWQIAREQLKILGIQPRRLSSTAWGITAEVPRASLDEVVRAWHRAFPGLKKEQ